MNHCGVVLAAPEQRGHRSLCSHAFLRGKAATRSVQQTIKASEGEFLRMRPSKRSPALLQ